MTHWFSSRMGLLAALVVAGLGEEGRPQISVGRSVLLSAVSKGVMATEVTAATLPSERVCYPAPSQVPDWSVSEVGC